MTDKLAVLSQDQFAAIWNSGRTLDDVVAKIRHLLGPVPRWAVLARALADRREGSELEHFAIAPARSADRPPPGM
jgi:hypothetical protein